jgi:predicted small lipoprotein YifL
MALGRLLLGVIAIAGAVAACGQKAPIDNPVDDLVTVYKVAPVDPATNYGHSWLALNPTTYRIGENEVVSKTAQFMSRYTDCAVLTPRDWECKYEGSSSSFGFRDGEFWQDPPDPEHKVVSRLEYLKIKCEWDLQGADRRYTSAELAQCIATGG